MPQIMRLNNDYVQGYGVGVSTPNQSVYVNGELAMVVGGYVSPHHQPDLYDQPVPMATGSPNVFIERKPVCRVGDQAQCGHQDVTGSPDTIAN